MSVKNEYVESGERAIDDWQMALEQGRGMEYLSSLDVRALSDADAVLLLSNLLLTMYDQQNYDDTLLDGVLDEFQVLRPAFARASPMEVVLITFPLIDLSAVSWVWMRKSVDIRSIILNLSEWLGNEDVDLVMSSALDIFLREDEEEIYDMLGNPPRKGTLADLLNNKTIATLMNEAERKGNDGMWNWLLPAYAVDAPLVGPPIWMMKESPSRRLPLPPSYIVGEPLNDETLGLLQRTIPTGSLSMATSIIRCNVSIVDSETKREAYGLDDNRYTSLEEERELFRLYGPSNTFIVDEPDEDLPPGADRMYLCDVFNVDEDFQVPTPIYTGSCDWKGHKISSERAAVRRPVSGGGWEGSYCSTTCIREQLEDSRGTEAVLDVDGVLGMVDVMEEQLVKWGVYENISNGSSR